VKDTSSDEHEDDEPQADDRNGAGMAKLPRGADEASAPMNSSGVSPIRKSFQNLPKVPRRDEPRHEDRRPGGTCGCE
jgi:hypothetical protein